MSEAQGEIDRVIAACFAAFDNRGGAAPGLATLPELFVPGATIVKCAAGGAEIMTMGASSRRARPC